MGLNATGASVAGGTTPNDGPGGSGVSSRGGVTQLAAQMP
jgi:hypothetical protein